MAKPLTDPMVASPAHYATGSVECIDAIESMLTPEEFVGFLRGTIMRYTWRCTRKGAALQDVQKLGWYRDRLERVLAARVET